MGEWKRSYTPSSCCNFSSGICAAFNESHLNNKRYTKKEKEFTAIIIYASATYFTELHMPQISKMPVGVAKFKWYEKIKMNRPIFSENEAPT